MASFRTVAIVTFTVLFLAVVGTYILGGLNAHTLNTLTPASGTGTLPDIYPAVAGVGNASCAPTFERLKNGLVGDYGCVDLLMGGGATGTLTTFALASINTGNATLNASCIPPFVVLPGGQVYVLPGMGQCALLLS
jgi:hypothetical protein